MSTSPQRKKLPVNPSLDHLKKQAKQRVKQNPALQLAAAQHTLAQEYGCKNWSELARMVETMSQRHDQAADLEQRYDAMPKAARAGNFEELRRLLDAGAFTPHLLDQSLAHVLWYGHESTWPARQAAADLLLEYGADPNGQYDSGGYGPIVFGTAECLQPDGLDYLIAAGADVTAPPIETKYGPQCVLSHLLGTYIRGQNKRKHRCLDLLLRHGAVIWPGVTAPVLAIHGGNRTALSALLDHDATLLHRTFANLPYGNLALTGATLLHCAAEFGESECVVELIARGADPNAMAETIDGIGGQTPIYHAIACAIDGDDAALLALLGDHRLAQLRSKGAKLSTLLPLFSPGQIRVDFAVRATWRRFGEAAPQPMNPFAFAAQLAEKIEPHRKADILPVLSLLAETFGVIESRKPRSTLSGEPHDEAKKFSAKNPKVRLTPRAHATLALASLEAKRFGHPLVEPEHLLLALTRFPGVGLVPELLRDLDLTPEAVRLAIEKEMPPSRPLTEVLETEHDSPLPPSSSLQAVLASAADEVQAPGLRFVGHAHLLVGLLGDGSSTAARILRSLGIDSTRVRAAAIAADRANPGTST